jgi:hypothetical protein
MRKEIEATVRKEIEEDKAKFEATMRKEIEENKAKFEATMLKEIEKNKAEDKAKIDALEMKLKGQAPSKQVEEEDKENGSSSRCGRKMRTVQVPEHVDPAPKKPRTDHAVDSQARAAPVTAPRVLRSRGTVQVPEHVDPAPKIPRADHAVDSQALAAPVTAPRVLRSRG